MTEPGPTSGAVSLGAIGVRVENLTHRYGRRTALADVEFSLGTGITALLGPNGAGKSTLLSILATVVAPSAGTVWIGEHDLDSREGLAAARRSLGYLPQRFPLMAWRSARQNVAYAAWANEVAAAECDEAALRALRVVDLEGRAEDKVRRLSGGMRQRVGLACAIAHRPTALLLDEPTAGLDPLQRLELRTYLRRISESTCVLLATHLVDDVERVADHVLVLREGRMVFSGAPAELGELDPGDDSGASALEGGYRALITGAAGRG